MCPFAIKTQSLQISLTNYPQLLFHKHLRNILFFKILVNSIRRMIYPFVQQICRKIDSHFHRTYAKLSIDTSVAMAQGTYHHASVRLGMQIAFGRVRHKTAPTSEVRKSYFINILGKTLLRCLNPSNRLLRRTANAFRTILKCTCQCR